MLRRRVIPCLDVADGRVVKGTRFVDLVDEGDPPELAERYCPRGRRRARLPRHHGRARTARHAARHRRADRAPSVHPADGRRRRPDGRRDARRAAGRCRQGLAQHGGRRRPGPDRAMRRRFGRQAVVVAIDARRRAADPTLSRPPGRSSSRVAGSRPTSTRSPGPDAPSTSVPGELLVTSIDRDGTGSGFDTELLRAITARVRVPGHRLGRRRRSGRPRRPRSATAAPTRSSPPRSSIAGSTRSARSRRRWPRPGLPVRLVTGGGGVTARDRGDLPGVRFGPDGLAPAIVQDAADGRVLMLAWMDAEALAATIDTGDVHFHSRSRDRLWRKGETSGHVLRLVSIDVDCDEDALLVTVDPVGPTCHRETRSCFDPDGAADRAGAGLRLARDPLVDHRPARRRSPGRLLHDVPARRRCRRHRAQGHRGGDRGPARRQGRRGRLDPHDPDALAGEAADLLYHPLVLLAERGPPRRGSSTRFARATPAEAAEPNLAGARSRVGACRSGPRATPRRSAPGRTPDPIPAPRSSSRHPTAIIRRASPREAKTPASASRAACPARLRLLART